MTEPLVSVVIPAYNEQAYIAEALDSVLTQTHQPLEVIVVDDGSEDHTAQIAADHGVQVIRRPHRGPSAARNTGLNASTGPYWTIFDADDLMPPHRIEHQLAHLQHHPEHDLVLGLTQAFTTPGQPKPPHYNPTWDHGPFHWHPGTTLGRREALDRVGLFDERLQLGEDLDWQARAREAGLGIGRVDQLCLRYRVHDANTSGDTQANRRAMLRLLRESIRRRREDADAR